MAGCTVVAAEEENAAAEEALEAEAERYSLADCSQCLVCDAGTGVSAGWLRAGSHRTVHQSSSVFRP